MEENILMLSLEYYLQNKNYTDLRCLPGIKGQQDKGRKDEMFYLTTHSTHFIYGYMA